MDICIYHGNCADGFGAAWAVRKALGEIEFFPATYQEPPPDVTGRNVIMVDFIYKYAELVKIADSCKTLLILDHHKTAVEEVARLHQYVEMCIGPDNVRSTMDMNRSGAMIAWDHFHPGKEPPQLIRHIQDRDLWLFKLEGTREIQANVFSFPYDFTVWDELMAMDVDVLRDGGIAIERKHHKDVAELVGVTKRRMVIGGYDVPVANLPYTLTSDAGHLMAQNEPFAACYWDTHGGRVFSLRSTDDGMDVSDVAKSYGGGGHRNAAGFQVPHTHVLARTALTEATP